MLKKERNTERVNSLRRKKQIRLCRTFMLKLWWFNAASLPPSLTNSLTSLNDGVPPPTTTHSLWDSVADFILLRSYLLILSVAVIMQFSLSCTPHSFSIISIFHHWYGWPFADTVRNSSSSVFQFLFPSCYELINLQFISSRMLWDWPLSPACIRCLKVKCETANESRECDQIPMRLNFGSVQLNLRN